MDLVIEEVDIIEVVCIVWELVIFNTDCHGGGPVVVLLLGVESADEDTIVDG